ncbi:MAG: DNA translocase FtsK [Arenicella sp.]
MAVAKKQNDDQAITSRIKELSTEIALISCIVVAGYALISLMSYSSGDPSWSNTGNGGAVTNFGGSFGAKFADMLLHGFGYMAYIAPILLLWAGFSFYKKRHEPLVFSYPKLLVVTAGIIMTIFGGCALESLHFGHLASSKPFVGGGILGDWIQSGLVATFGAIGSTLLAVILFLAGITFFTGLSWFWLMDTLGKKTCDLIESVQGMREEKEDKAIGEKAREKRIDSVAVLRKKTEKKTPIKIEPKVAAKKPVDSGRMAREKQATLFESFGTQDHELPPLAMLDQPEEAEVGYSPEELEAMSILLVKKLADFNVDVEVVSVHQGPVITRFEVDLAPGVKAATIVGLAKDLARGMSIISVRVVENIPGKSYIGIELPNEKREIVKLIEGISSNEFESSNSPLTLVLGKDISGETVVADLAKMPHVLIAGTTGSGKSVCINALIASVLYKASAKEVRMIMIDPKMLELSVYEGIPHLLAPVVTDMNEAANSLRWSIYEMERRYKLMSELGVRNLAGYNRKVKLAKEAGEPIMDPLTKEGQEPEALDELPCLMIIIDELADLMMVVGKKVEELITRLAQKGRASGVHLLLATQRPSVDVITGLLKANVPTRIAFQVQSKIDSRTILDQMGAEQLLGHGDMLYMPPGTSMPVRVHGSFVSDEEVHQIVQHLKKGAAPEYEEAILNGPKEVNQSLPAALQAESDDPEDDPLYDQAVDFVTRSRKSSISAVQRQLRVGYNRAARMIETMEAAGLVGPLEHGKREIYVPPVDE